MYMVNISIDDVSPHPLSSVKVLERCYELIEEYKQIKFTLFVPMAYWRTVGNTATKGPLFINHFSDFCETLKQLPSENFELGYHGYHHGIPGVSNNDEFKKINFQNADNLFKMMFEIAEAAGLHNTFNPIFRPPAWKMSKDAINAAQSNNIDILALSPKFNYEKKFDKTVYLTCNPPFDPLEYSTTTEIVYHACEWDRNYLSKDMTLQLKEFLSREEKDIKFCFMEEMV